MTLTTVLSCGCEVENDTGVRWWCALCVAKAKAKAKAKRTAPEPLDLSGDYWTCHGVDGDHWVIVEGARLNLSHYHRVLEARLRLAAWLANGRAA
jgi:hypothetical protein